MTELSEAETKLVDTVIETVVDSESVQSVEDALALIDQGLGGLTERQMVPASEVTDLLLDVRALLREPAPSA